MEDIMSILHSQVKIGDLINQLIRFDEAFHPIRLPFVNVLINEDRLLNNFVFRQYCLVKSLVILIDNQLGMTQVLL